MKRIFLILIIAVISCASVDAQSKQQRPEPKNFVPDTTTAIRIAEAVWLPIYGESVLTKKPFTAKLLKNNIWLVEGYLDPESVGGVPYIEIQKEDGRILRVYHTK